MRIEIKPLSVNKCWQGRRFKTPEYKDYELSVCLLLVPKEKKEKALRVPKGKLKVDYVFGLSSKNADIDNCVKPLTDILQSFYDFNDKQIYEMNLKKVDVPKGCEYISFSIKQL